MWLERRDTRQISKFQNESHPVAGFKISTNQVELQALTNYRNAHGFDISLLSNVIQYSRLYKEKQSGASVLLLFLSWNDWNAIGIIRSSRLGPLCAHKSCDSRIWQYTTWNPDRIDPLFRRIELG